MAKQPRGPSGRFQAKTPVVAATAETKRQAKPKPAAQSARTRRHGITIDSPEACGTRGHDGMADA